MKRIPAADNDVARFLQQSKLHMTKLKEVFDGVATVKISIKFQDKYDGDIDEQIEYRFLPFQVILF